MDEGGSAEAGCPRIRIGRLSLADKWMKKDDKANEKRRVAGPVLWALLIVIATTVLTGFSAWCSRTDSKVSFIWPPSGWGFGSFPARHISYVHPNATSQTTGWVTGEWTVYQLGPI